MQFSKDIPKQRNVSGYQMGPSLKLSNGYILPEGKMTPNTLFVGGIDTKVSQVNIDKYLSQVTNVCYFDGTDTFFWSHRWTKTK